MKRLRPRAHLFSVIGDSHSECWTLYFSPHSISGFLGGAVVKNSPANAGDAGDLSLIPGLGRPPGEGNGNPLQYSCLKNSWTEEPGGFQTMGSQIVGHD